MPQIDTSTRRIIQITWPVLITQLSHTAMGVIDTVMVGRLGIAALGAVGLGNLLTWWVLSFFWGMLSGVNTMVAQAEGARRRRAAGAAFWQGIYLALLSAVGIALFWPLAPRIMAWIGTSLETRAIAGEYMQIRLLGGLGFGLFLVADNFYRGLGRTRVPMWAGIAQAILNCGLNYSLIFGKMGAPALGTAGAAWGTVAAQLIVALVLIGTILRSREIQATYEIKSTWRPDRQRFAGLVRLSLPIGGQVFMEMGGIAVFTALVARLGDAQMAATNAVIQAWSVGYMTAYALSVGATTLVGQCVGAGYPEDSRRVVRKILKMGYVAMAVPGLVYLTMPEQIMGIFVRQSEIEALLPFARPLFAIVVICLAIDLQFNVLAGALRGAGDTTFVMWTNIGSAWLLFVPATMFAAARWGVVGAWACLILHLAAMVLMLEIRFHGRRWLEKRVELGPDGDCG